VVVQPPPPAYYAPPPTVIYAPPPPPSAVVYTPPPVAYYPSYAYPAPPPSYPRHWRRHHRGWDGDEPSANLWTLPWSWLPFDEGEPADWASG
jgi:hypothetical protein